MADYQTLFNISVSIIGVLLGYVINGIFRAIRDIKDNQSAERADITAIQIALPTFYVNKEETKQMGDRIFTAIRDLKAEQETTLARIENKLDQKMDKHL